MQTLSLHACASTAPRNTAPGGATAAVIATVIGARPAKTASGVSLNDSLTSRAGGKLGAAAVQPPGRSRVTVVGTRYGSRGALELTCQPGCTSSSMRKIAVAPGAGGPAGHVAVAVNTRSAAAGVAKAATPMKSTPAR